ncbi:MAG: tetratricopeptide repeat protein [Bryobacteraceae bacterium]|nr:tetratricopeptide repeat protein [Bryobacteraceae bacterium]
MMRKLCRAAVWAGVMLAGAQELEQPVGLVLTSKAAKLRRSGSELPLTAKSGDVIFAGDALVADGGSATFLFCPGKSSQTVASTGEVLFERKQLRVKTGQLSDVQKQDVCVLPAMERESTASQQHLGASVTRSAPQSVTPDDLQGRIEKLSEGDRKSLAEELAPVDKALAANEHDLGARVARAAVFEKYKLLQHAIQEYRRVQSVNPDAVWVRSRLFVHEQQEASAAPAAAAGKDALTGKTYALLVGISKYQIDRISALRYAHEDALLFEKHLRSPRGGGLAESDITVLTNEQATLAGVRNAFDTLLKRKAGKQDTVLLFFAAHGTTTDKGVGYIITHDADPQDLASTALPMRDVQKLFRDELAHVGRVLLYVDVCRAGAIGSVQARSNRINTLVENLTDEGEMFGMLASRKDEVAVEGPQFGGGHGAFSYFLLDALNGAADANRNGAVDAIEIVDYVSEKVKQATASRQNPKEIGNAGTATMAVTSKPGIRLDPYNGPIQIASRDGQAGNEPTRSLQGGAASSRSNGPGILEGFSQALAAKRVLPDVPDGAFALLATLRKQLPAEDYAVQENRLRVALEDLGQQVLLKYLTGDQNPQAREDFMTGAAYFSTARLLTPESLLLEAREDFCLGRAALFDKDYNKSISLLERAVRADSPGAYSYNALGIAYLEQARYELAILAFRDAVKRAPYWPYPLHNMALAYVQTGDYRSAIRSYEEAIRLAPRYSYLPYNLGLIYQRLNRTKQAEAAYRSAIELSPESAEPYNALGYLRAATGQRAEAEKLYRQALEKNPALLPARQNLALVIAEDQRRFPEAVELWKQNLAKTSDYLPSLISLARALASHGGAAESASFYEKVVALRPEYVAARRALADVYVQLKNADAAVLQLRAALQAQPRNALVYEQLGDIEQSRGRVKEAAAAWLTALEQSADDTEKKRIRRKLK